MNKYLAGNANPLRLQVPLLRAIILLLGAVCTPLVLAEDRREHSTAEISEQDEIQWQLPAAPLPENLLPFYTSTVTGQNFAVDAKSLTVDKDGVIRYTMVATSPGGARNVSYEGIRCRTQEKKLYAFGHADGSWGKARDPQWDAIPSRGANLQQYNLAQDFLCKNSLVPGKTGQILEELHYHSGRVQPGQS